MFKPVDPDVSFPKLEENILLFREENGTLAKSIENREDAAEFVFYDGPSFATGLPHYGHLVPGLLKDIVPRYWTMRGHRVTRRFGWDSLGLPVENERGISGRQDIEKMGIAKFNETSRSIVLRFTAEWRKTITRRGFLCEPIRPR